MCEESKLGGGEQPLTALLSPSPTVLNVQICQGTPDVRHDAQVVAAQERTSVDPHSLLCALPAGDGQSDRKERQDRAAPTTFLRSGGAAGDGVCVEED